MKRDVNGVLLLEKPEGITSNAALQKAKFLMCAKKAGHTGSLDPMASGMLPICFGEATKFAQFFIADDKMYRVCARLGTKTDSADRTGTVIETKSVPNLTQSDVENVLQNFMGDIEQIPPMYSALKVKGQRLYKLARAGIEVERKPRKITIYRLTLESLHTKEDGVYLTLAVTCSKGTYIRTLVEDLCLALGTVGHVHTLYRHFVGQFNPSRMVTLEQLQAAKDKGFDVLDKYLVPLEEALPKAWPKIPLSASTSFYLQQGQTVRVPGLPEQGLVQICHMDGSLIGIGEIQAPARLAPKRLIRSNT